MIVFKAIKPGTKFRSSVFRETVRERAERIAPKMLADFKKTTRTFKNHKPEFEVHINVGAKARQAKAGPPGASVEIFTTDEIYGYLDQGTKVRYATMSKDFSAKTQPRIIGSRAGRGRMLFVNKKRPRPGIKARKFSETIRKKWQPEFTKHMRQAMAEGARASGHGR